MALCQQCLWGSVEIKFVRWCPANEEGELSEEKQEVGVSGAWRNHRAWGVLVSHQGSNV